MRAADEMPTLTPETSPDTDSDTVSASEIPSEESEEECEAPVREDVEDTPTGDEAEEIEDNVPEREGEADDVPEREGGETLEVDYAALATEDIATLKREFPEIGESFDLSRLADPMRYGALRDLGLSPREAYLATGGRRVSYDNRSHLKGTVPRGARSSLPEIPRSELSIAREIFSDVSEKELERLYRKVTK